MAGEVISKSLLVPPLVRFSALACAGLAQAREELDALNVYPVPDGDTGTNLFLTFEAAEEALHHSLREQGGQDAATPEVTLAAYARALLLGARGNSGVIMAQLVSTLFQRIGNAAVGERSALAFAEGMDLAADAAYAAVGEPVEGTILTVARAASRAALQAATDERARTAQVVLYASRAAREALEHTPEQLAVLGAAGVVDAGGRGLCVVLEAAYAAYIGRRELIHDTRRSRRPLPIPTRSVSPAAGDDLSPDGPSYEVMYLLEAAEDQIAALRARLLPLGDSLVVVGGDQLWNVHVHVDDVGAAIEAGIEAGRPYRVRVTHFAEQAAARSVADARTDAAPRRAGRRVLVLSATPGLAQVYAEAGACVLQVPVDRRLVASDLLAAIRATGAAQVVVLPGDRDLVPTAQAAAGLAEDDDPSGPVEVVVIGTHTQVQGIAALAVHDPGRPLESDLLEMSAAARHCRSGAVTIADSDAITTAGHCAAGDALGAIEGDFVVVGTALDTIAIEVMERLLGGGGELVTLIAGEGGADLLAACVAHLAAAHPTTDVVCYNGGQARYPVLIGVE